MVGEGEKEVGWLGDEAGRSEQVAGACGGVVGQGPVHDAPQRCIGLDQLHKLGAGHGGCLPPGVPPLDQVPCLKHSPDQGVFEGDSVAPHVALVYHMSQVCFETLRE